MGRFITITVIFKGNIVGSMMTRRLAEFVSSLSYSEIPPDATEMARICFLDFLGVALRGSSEMSGLMALGAMSKGSGGATIIGHGRGDTERAALLNGIFAHNLDLDDGHRGAQMHPGSCVIPAALAAAEATGATFRDFITAMVAGYEVAIFMGILANPGHRELGFHTTGTCGTFGAAAAASRIICSDVDAVVNALGIAGTQAAGLLESDHAGTMAKHLHAGRAAQSGLISARLASHGFTGAESVIDGDEGFLRAMCRSDGYGGEAPEVGAFHIRNVYLKRYPVCRHLHSTLDAAAEIIRENDFRASEIEEVIVSTYRIAAEHDSYSPATVEAVRQSLPVSLGILLEGGELRVEDLEGGFSPEMASRIRIEVDPDMEELRNMRPSRVTVRLRNGEVLTAYRELPRGEPEEPYTWDDIVEKFRELNPGYETERLEVIGDADQEPVAEVMLELSGR
jgi:2-methylcitrate dehydratase PrpD